MLETHMSVLGEGGTHTHTQMEITYCVLTGKTFIISITSIVSCMLTYVKLSNNGINLEVPFKYGLNIL